MPLPPAAKPSMVIQQQNLAEQVADYLTQAIIGQDFAPGERLSEVQLARDLGISRAPVREASRLLESRGLLISRPRRGFFVRALNAGELADIFDLRLCLERHAIERLACTCSSDVLAALRRQVNLMCEVSNTGDEGRRIEEDLAFHRLLIATAGNRRLLGVFDNLAHELRLCITLITKIHEAPESIADSHHLLLDALASGEQARCREAIDYHIGVARDYVVRGLSEPSTD